MHRLRDTTAAIAQFKEAAVFWQNFLDKSIEFEQIDSNENDKKGTLRRRRSQKIESPDSPEPERIRMSNLDNLNKSGSQQGELLPDEIISSKIEQDDFDQFNELPLDLMSVDEERDAQSDAWSDDNADFEPDDDDDAADTSNVPKNRSNNRQYEICPICNKTFSELGRHTRWWHPTEESPLECGQCDRKFTDKAAMHEHFKDDHQLIQYTCDICLKPNSSR